jgi:glycosyltransferase involved in cell wall biosynthesis
MAVYDPIKRLKSMGHTIDFFTTNFFEDFTDFYKYNNQAIVDNLIVADWKKSPKQKIIQKFINKFEEIKKKLLSLKNKYYYPFNKIPIHVLKIFHRTINKGNYDFVYIHHYYWHELISKTIFPETTKIVAHFQDMLFTQLYYLDKNIDMDKVGRIFSAEIKNLTHFHYGFFISFDEYFLTKRFVSSAKFFYFPYIAEKKIHCEKNKLRCKKTIDLLYLGHDNPFNIQGANWFLDSVFPNLKPNISITFCGKMVSKLSNYYLMKIRSYGIATIDFLEDIDELYSNTMVVMVPILEGTGMKIKTVEAMAHGIPIVSTLLGIDGFPDKFENGCLTADDPIEFALNINNLLSDDDLYYTTINKQNAYYDKYFSSAYVKNLLEKVFTN